LYTLVVNFNFLTRISSLMMVLLL